MTDNLPGKDLRYQNRLIYDQLAYVHHLNQSVSPYKYVTENIPHVHPNECVQEQPGFFMRQNSAVPKNANVVNIESELYGLFRKNSLAPEEKYNPNNPKPSPCSDKGTLDGNCYPLKPFNLPACPVSDPIVNLPRPINTTGLPALQ